MKSKLNLREKKNQVCLDKKKLWNFPLQNKSQVHSIFL